MLDGTQARRILRVTADDFGFTPGVTEGIIEAYEKGIVTHTSVMARGLDVERAIARAKEMPGLRIGIHLTLTWGRSLSPPENVPTLIGKDRRFNSLRVLVIKFLSGRLNRSEVTREWRAQIERVIGFGLTLSHADSHHHIHLLPGLLPLAAQIAREYGIPRLRRPVEPIWGDLRPRDALVKRILFKALAPRAWPLAAADAFRGLTLQGKPDLVLRLRKILHGLPPGTTELMVHPGRPDPLLEREDTYVREREIELQGLCDPAVTQLLAELKIELDRSGNGAGAKIS